MHNYRCCGDADDLDDGDVLASDSLDTAEAHMLLCKIVLWCLMTCSISAVSSHGAWLMCLAL